MPPSENAACFIIGLFIMIVLCLVEKIQKMLKIELFTEIMLAIRVKLSYVNYNTGKKEWIIPAIYEGIIPGSYGRKMQLENLEGAMRLMQLEYFIKVAECGSITKAAQELYLSQPSLTKAISNLEAEYGLQLLERTSKGITVTPRGRDFLEYAKNVVTAKKTLENVFLGGESKERLRLYVASQQFDFLYPIVEELYQNYAAKPVYIDLEETDRGEIINRVWNRDVDLGFLVLSKEDTKFFKQELEEKALEIHTLDTSTVYVCMCDSSSLYKKERITVEDAAPQLHVVLDWEKSMRRELLSGHLHQNMKGDHLIFSNNIRACVYFMKRMGALLYAPKWVLGMLEKEQVRSVPLELPGGEGYPLVNRLVWLKRSNEELSEAEKLFVDKVKKALLQDR